MIAGQGRYVGRLVHNSNLPFPRFLCATLFEALILAFLYLFRLRSGSTEGLDQFDMRRAVKVRTLVDRVLTPILGA